MGEKASTVLVGVGGYGDLYPSLYEKYEDIRDICSLVGIVDPYAATAPHFNWFKEQGIPIYNTLEEFYQAHTARLAVISTPIPLHKPQCLTALAHGSHVLCEKPLVPALADAAQLKRAAEQAGRTLGVGFQWSFSHAMNRLKRDILAGELGKPLMLKSLILWQRETAYYSDSTWKGRIIDNAGHLIRDSVVTNATAHYLHNIFFVLGSQPDRAAMPGEVTAQVYRAKDIQSFDTCALTGRFLHGGAFWYGASHAADMADQTRFRYIFQKATVYFNDRPEDPRDHMIAVFADGRVTDYGNPQAFSELAPKFLTMLRHCLDDKQPAPCTVETILPHLAVCTGLFEKGEPACFPAGRLFQQTQVRPGVYVRGLSDLFLQAYEQEVLPCQVSGGEQMMPASFRFTPERQGV